MARRIVVSPICAKRCPSCFVCETGSQPASLQEALDTAPESDERPVLLGGGDATQWPHLHAYLKANSERPKPYKVWIEAPAASLTDDVVKDLAARGLNGAIVQIEAFGLSMIKALGVGDGEEAIARAEAAGLKTEARVCVRPKTMSIIAPLARKLAPRTVWLELFRQDWGKAPTNLPVELLDKSLALTNNVQFSAHRVQDSGYLPPCTMPQSWRANPRMWQSTFAERTQPNTSLSVCGECVFNKRCQWSDSGALSSEAEKAAKPIRNEPPLRRIEETAVPEIIVKKRRLPDVVCTEPWTTIEMAGHDGNVNQCGGNWTAMIMGNVAEKPLSQIWNDKPFQEARKLMGRATVKALCNPICTRLYDGVLAEKRFKIQAGSERFVQNQLLMAEEIAERREIVKSMPRHMTLCPSSYCNYKCVFCDHGTKPDRWDMPEHVWEELPMFLPTLKTLTLLGGEPFASHRVWEFLTTFDTEKYPDVRLDIFTNGALMTERALSRVRSSSLGEITISLNSGSAEVYEQIERPASTFDQVVANVDALIRLRDRYPWWFGITLSLIVMRENAGTLIQFGRLALERNLHIRLVGLLIRRPEDEPYNFYKNPDDVRRVLIQLDEFIDWALRSGRPDYAKQAVGAKDAITGQGAQSSGVAASALIPLGVGTHSFRAA